MTVIDHTIGAMLAIACVAQLFASIDPESHDRATLYKAGAGSGLLFAGAPLLPWWAEERPLAAFGLFGWVGDPATALAAGAAWAAVLTLCLALVRRGVLRRALETLYGHYAWFMPRNRRELHASWGTSVLAGSGEEIAFRGFLLWYLAALIGLPAALLVSSLLFGAAHSYQRALGMGFATIAGLLLGLAYLGSGSLLLVMWMHATWNIASFTAGGIVLSRSGGDEQRPL